MSSSNGAAIQKQRNDDYRVKFETLSKLLTDEDGVGVPKVGKTFGGGILDEVIKRVIELKTGLKGSKLALRSPTEPTKPTKPTKPKQSAKPKQSVKKTVGKKTIAKKQHVVVDVTMQAIDDLNDAVAFWDRAAAFRKPPAQRRRA
jgi:hypothetical protein